MILSLCRHTSSPPATSAKRVYHRFWYTSPTEMGYSTPSAYRAQGDEAGEDDHEEEDAPDGHCHLPAHETGHGSPSQDALAALELKLEGEHMPHHAQQAAQQLADDRVVPRPMKESGACQDGDDRLEYIGQDDQQNFLLAKDPIKVGAGQALPLPWLRTSSRRTYLEMTMEVLQQPSR